jgi:hypothetical protein
MAKFSDATINDWREKAAGWLAANTTLTAEAITTGRDAWTVAHRCGITGAAYTDRTVTDGHIQTALEKVFPNAVFRDKKVY